MSEKKEMFEEKVYLFILLCRKVPENNLLVKFLALDHLALLPLHQRVDVHPVHQLRYQALQQLLFVTKNLL
jgi:hypothetical protein